MRRTIAVFALAALPLSLTACGDAVESVREGVGEVADQAQEAATLVQFCKAALDVANAVNDGNWDQAIARGEVMVAEAPDEIRPDAQTVLDGAKRIRDGETAVAQDESFQAAADRVEQFTRDRCNPTN